MVALCCCFHDDDPGENASSSNRGFIHTLFNKYAALFNNEEPPASAATNRRPPTSLNPDPAESSVTQSETSRIPPIIPAFDSKPGPSNNAAAIGESCKDTVQEAKVRAGLVLEFVGIPKENNSKPHSSTSSKVEPKCCHIYKSADDDDVCPTCLEEYSLENPRILTQCSHHYHLSCIYEWMERSPTCPVCNQLMVFDETS